MTVTPLSSRTPSAATPRSRRTEARQRRASTSTEGSGLTISFEITLDGESRYSDAVRILDTLRLVTDRLDTATLEIAPTASVDEPYAGTLPAGATLRALSSRSSLDSDEASSWLDGPEAPSWPDAADTRAGRRVEIMPDTRSVAVAGEQIALTRVEFDLLIFLARHPRRVFDRPQLLRNVWGYEHTGLRTVDVHIRRLRAKLGDDLVTTVRSVGYRLSDKANTHISHSF